MRRPPPLLLLAAAGAGAVLCLRLDPARARATTAPPTPREALLRWFDGDGDGLVDRFEAAAGAMRIVAEEDADGDGALSAGELDGVLSDALEVEYAEVQEVLDAFDGDGDGRLARDEAPAWLSDGFSDFDADGDGFVDRAELNDAIAWFDGEEAADPEGEAERLFAGDRNGDEVLARDEIPPEEEMLREDFEYADRDGDGVLSRAELLAHLERDGLPAWFEVVGERARMQGTIDASTPARFLEMLWRHPEVREVELSWVPGSVDDDATLLVARWIRERGLATRVPRRGTIASGGVELFLGGVRRTVEEGARVGVHSWGAGPFEGSDYAADHPDHKLYVDFLREMGVDEAFYWFTLRAAPSDSIHWMTREEIGRFGLETE